MSDPIVGLADAIEALRAELEAAMNEGANKPIQFRIDPIQLDVQVAVTKDAGGKVGWSVFGLGASRQSATTQTLHLTLAPLQRRADGTLSNEFVIAGVGPANQKFGPAVAPASDRTAQPDPSKEG